MACAAALASVLPAAADALAGATPTATATATGTGRARATATRAATATRTPTPSPTGMATAAAPRSTATAPAPTATLVSVAVVAQTELPPATEEITVTRGGQSITRHVLKTVRTADGREAAAGRVVVRFRDGTDDSTRTRIHAESATRATGGSPAAGRTTRAAATDSSLQRQVVELPGGADLDSAVLAYRSDSRVLFAEPDYVFRAHETPNDPFFATQWGLEKIGAATAWNVTHGGAATIAILDCGIFDETSAYLPPGGDGLAGHPDIRGKVTARHNLSGMPDADDFCNHGTHVAGIAAAATNNGVGGSGVGFDARLLNVKVLDDGGSGSNLSVAQGITWAAANGAKVINMSLGAPGACPTTLQSAIDAAWSRGVVIVAAAGND